MQQKIPIVTEQFLRDAIDDGKVPDESSYEYDVEESPEEEQGTVKNFTILIS